MRPGQNHDSNGDSTQSDRDLAAPATLDMPQESFLDRLVQDSGRIVLAFAGQGVSCIDELASLYEEAPSCRPWVHAASDALIAMSQNQEWRWSGLYRDGFDLARWVLDPTSRPDPAYLTSGPISQPIIFIAQMARYAWAMEQGLGAAFDAGAIVGAVGHSQGMMPALLISESPGGHVRTERLVDYTRYLGWQGFHMAMSWRSFGVPPMADASPMAAVSGPSLERLQALVDAVNSRLPETAHATIALRNTRTRNVVSGPAATLERLHQQIERVAAKEDSARKAGQLGGAPLAAIWEYLAVDAAYHSAFMEAGRGPLLERIRVSELDFDASALRLPVFSPADGSRFNDATDLLATMVSSQCTEPVRWSVALREAVQSTTARVVIDMGPGVGVARLSASAMKGAGVRVLALAEPSGREAIFGPIADDADLKSLEPLDYSDFAPTLQTRPDGSVVIDNRYTRATGMSPVILPGMTPTTVDAGICAAAANAGFTAELAGGGQVTDAIFQTRIAELKELLTPGRQVVFNALYLDRYLWDLHLGRTGIVQKAARAGAPFCGVTISAGIPEPDEAAALLDDLHDAGLWLNAFKPGTIAQVDQVVRIAQAAPHHTVFMHLEGGRAGGHHSWEDLSQLLLATYFKIRSQANLVLCVGGGIADEARGVDLLTGHWARAFGAADMPVDAILLGTITMACKEATASESVKAALVEAIGTPEWVYPGQASGGVTSGKSQLNADIHYLDSSAARCGRLLDAVAGDADAVAKQRDVIIEALNATAKPYFGDVSEMTWAQVLRRMAGLMAFGSGGRYDDGIWPDRSYRARFADVAARSEARLQSVAGPSVLADATLLDAPDALIAGLAATLNGFETERLTLSDAEWFVRAVCARPGKPVCFVPIIDQDVRRWFKSDSLWQAQDSRFDSDRVLVLPGPAAVAGITRANEPVAEILGRFDAALIAERTGLGIAAPAAEWVRRTERISPIADTDSITATEETTEGQWFDAIGQAFEGAVAHLFAADRVFEGHASVPNPVRVLCAPESGATLSWTTLKAGDALDALTYRPAAPWADESVRVFLSRDGAVVIELNHRPVPGAPTPTPWTRIAHIALDGAIHLETAGRDASLRTFYHQSLFGRALEPVPLFFPAHATATIEPARRDAYAALSGAPSTGPLPANMLFTLAWEAQFAALSCDEIVGGLSRLVHLDNRVTWTDGATLNAGESVKIEARITRIESSTAGQTVSARATFRRDGAECAQMVSRYFIRHEGPATGADTVRAIEQFDTTIILADAAEREFLTGQPGFVQRADTLPLNTPLTFTASINTEKSADSTIYPVGRADVFLGETNLASLSLDNHIGGDAHPFRVLANLLSDTTNPWVDTTRRTLASATVSTPSEGSAWADISRDLNPIHSSGLFARLAYLPAPIVHGMWTAARLHGFLVTEIAGGNPARLNAFEAAFLAPALHGERLRLSAVRVAARDGVQRIEATGIALRDGQEIPVVRASVELAPPTTAYIFPGQGIQRQGMGMEAYASSPAARNIWDRADAYTRREFGFSVLNVVRGNPKSVLVGPTTYRHPDGVIHLTQFTQVSMAVLAHAQVAQLRAAGVLVPGAVTCGHSVGEYSAVSGISGVLPLEAVIKVVWHRGLTMHQLVPRDAEGRSPYAMGVVRPHYAGLRHTEIAALVDSVSAESGGFIEIVNYNVMGRQYAVTGELPALAMLAERLMARAIPGGKPPWVPVPGLDVPFHSSVLRPGVPAFRTTLDACLPADGPYLGLVGRYIPNLMAAPMALTQAYLNDVVALTKSPIVQGLLADWDAQIAAPVALARTLLIELLSWQFASPVRWIETQAQMLTPAARGGLGVDRVIELGVGYQPTAANMMRATLAMATANGAMANRGPGSEVVVWNMEAEGDLVLLTDSDPEVVVFEDEPEPSAEAVISDGETPAAAPVAAAPMAAAPIASGPSAEDRPVTHLDGLKAILAVQGKVRPEQLRDAETIDELFEGVSSRRNQVLLDIGAEFQLGSIDGAHEQPLTDLAAELARRSPRWSYPGPYLGTLLQESLRRSFGRASMGKKDITADLIARFGLGDGLLGHALLELALVTREGESGRGGALGPLSAQEATSKASAKALLDAGIASLSTRLGAPINPVGARASGGGAAVDAAVVAELEAKILGPDGALTNQVRDMAERLGQRLESTDARLVDADPRDARLALIEAEHGAAWERLIAPRFEPEKHVVLGAAWAWARRDIARLFYGAFDAVPSAEMAGIITRLAAHAASDTSVLNNAIWYAGVAETRGDDQRAAWLRAIATGAPTPAFAATPFTPSRPELSLCAEGRPDYREVPDEGADAVQRLLAQFYQGAPGSAPGTGHLKIGEDGALNDAFYATLTDAIATPLSFQGVTALVTGASPHSIAIEAVGHILRGGGQVVATTTTYNRERLAWYRAFYQDHAAPGATLHIVPFNQASNQDIDALVTWLFAEIVEQDGPNIRVVKAAMAPDLILPFAALKDMATVDTLGPRAEAAMRVMLLSVERLTGAIARHYIDHGLPPRPCHTVLPLSPNHGSFGGDGAYAETKAALEVLCNKWHSEQDAWGLATTLSAARIGWVRGTGLMDANNIVAQGLEDETGARTFSSAEMGWLIAALGGDWARSAALDGPLHADLTGGFAEIGDIRTVVAGIRASVEAKSMHAVRLAGLRTAEAEALGAVEPGAPQISPLPAWPQEWPTAPDSGSAPNAAGSWPKSNTRLEDTIVIVGGGELGPCGNSRTRLALEIGAELSAPAVMELAWMTGLIVFEANERGGAWIDLESGEPVDERAIADRYRDAVAESCGIRMIDPATTGFDPNAAPVLAKTWLDRDFTFTVGSETEAREFIAADPEHTEAAWDAEGERWRVTRMKGAEIRVPKVARLPRRVAGVLPTGFELSRFGIPAEMVESVDRLTLFNLIATVDAFLSAGITPEDLLRWVHPTRVANTQGSGIGGMASLQRLYWDHLLGEERQSDVLQETLINVIAAYVVTSYTGSYGSMSHPVGACATASLSLESAAEKIMVDKADFVVAGGYDDIGSSGLIGFADMNATCDTDQMLAMGFEPNQMSRSNDVRRRGFVEAQGGGTVLLARGDLALKMGLPVRGVLAYTASFGDGLQKSIPAPGQGALACAMGGMDSPLGRALTAHGLSADDIALVYKHDTSTGANDPNENGLHHRIQLSLGRTPGNPLMVVSQKSLTGHSKGGAAAWQTLGLCQALSSGTVPPNPNLECVDPAMRPYSHMLFTDTAIETGAGGLRAGLVTSLGFGHVSGVSLVLHPDAFTALLDGDQLAAWTKASKARTDWAAREREAILTERRPTFERRTHRRFMAADGTEAQRAEEAAMLLDSSVRLDIERGVFAPTNDGGPGSGGASGGNA